MSADDRDQSEHHDRGTERTCHHRRYLLGDAHGVWMHGVHGAYAEITEPAGPSTSPRVAIQALIPDLPARTWGVTREGPASSASDPRRMCVAVSSHSLPGVVS
jgi:hypothetical protein